MEFNKHKLPHTSLTSECMCVFACMCICLSFHTHIYIIKAVCMWEMEAIKVGKLWFKVGNMCWFKIQVE